MAADSNKMAARTVDVGSLRATSNVLNLMMMMMMMMIQDAQLLFTAIFCAI
jgi:hypothetical protein